MGLFINNNDHPEVFKNKDKIQAPNQNTFKIDYLSELMMQQREANKVLTHSFLDLKILYEQQEKTHTDQWTEIGKHLDELRDIHLKHEKFEGEVIDWLSKLEDKSSKEKEDELAIKQQWLEQMTKLNEMNNEIVNRLKKSEFANEQLILKIKDQMDIQMQMKEELSEQKVIQEQVSNRLENQEALTEKILREISHLRSVLFERASFLAEKIENGFKLTSAYVYKLMNGNDQSLTLLMAPEKKESKKQER
ncbi:hypothetical protein ACFFF5_16045 [Lederbergia wuyishanensis]|uniref:Fructose-specific phosphotransferase system component IIB n=1 Tax=Lederbergia wuyishanensis TaxID=1347903 RepID=A0ABU0D606_9BACI|nr:hypothetical protein [Lederbergia wuyishanensis]MCJ8008384.1 hypothetical protein [Lederbergia wuyishanensis]MDQ0343798.1 fructose-specific phosphotransferase system component IIB [Lederbergia wuyishanensis]